MVLPGRWVVFSGVGASTDLNASHLRHLKAYPGEKASLLGGALGGEVSRVASEHRNREDGPFHAQSPGDGRRASGSLEIQEDSALHSSPVLGVVYLFIFSFSLLYFSI